MTDYSNFSMDDLGEVDSDSHDECETCGAKDGGEGGSVEWRNMEDKPECDRCYHGRGSNS